MNAVEQAELPRPAVDAQLLNFAQMETAIRFSGYFYPKIHPAIDSAVILPASSKDLISGRGGEAQAARLIPELMKRASVGTTDLGT